jgi:hypothetical protein
VGLIQKTFESSFEFDDIPSSAFMGSELTSQDVTREAKVASEPTRASGWSCEAPRWSSVVSQNLLETWRSPGYILRLDIGISLK